MGGTEKANSLLCFIMSRDDENNKGPHKRIEFQSNEGKLEVQPLQGSVPGMSKKKLNSYRNFCVMYKNVNDHSFYNKDLDYSFNHILYLWGK